MKMKMKIKTQIKMKIKTQMKINMKMKVVGRLPTAECPLPTAKCQRRQRGNAAA